MKKMIGAILLTLSVSALAQEQGHLSVQTTVQKETVVMNENGEQETTLVPAETVVPGERVIYTITFENVSDQPAGDVVITNPISDNLIYVDGSAFGPGTDIEFSVDGGQSFAAANELTVDEDGASRAATVDDFTHIRWVMQNELAVGAQGTARFTAQLK
ncbi:MAG: hypothetical protein AAF351_10575 [Pseudomonadota bacterium]